MREINFFFVLKTRISDDTDMSILKMRMQRKTWFDLGFVEFPMDIFKREREWEREGESERQRAILTCIGSYCWSNSIKLFQIYPQRSSIWMDKELHQKLCIYLVKFPGNSSKFHKVDCFWRHYWRWERIHRT